MHRRLIAKFFTLTLLGIGLIQPANAQPPATNPDRYIPGFGVLMDGIQLRHAKLWFAGVNENWPLAKFLADEIKEDFDDVIILRPTYKRKSIVETTKLLLAKPIQHLNAAITNRDRTGFESAFDSLSQACNACHAQVDIGFVFIQRPTVPPLTNQQFSPQ